MPRIYTSPHINRPNNSAAKLANSVPRSNRSSNDSIKSLVANEGSVDFAQAVAAFQPVVESCLSRNDSTKDVKNSSTGLSRSRSSSPLRKAVQENNKSASSQNAQAKPVDRRTFMSDVKQEVMADDFCKLINRLEKLTYRLEASVGNNGTTAKTVIRHPSVSVAEKPASSGEESHPPVFELVGKKWRVEHQKKQDDLVIAQSNSKQSVYIHACQECKIKISDKCQSVLIDACTNVEVELGNVHAAVEILGSKNVEVRLLDEVPTVNVDKVEGALIYLSNKSLDTVVVTAKSTGVNILVPNEDDDTKHTPELIAEQFKTIVNSKSRKLITTPSELFL